MYDTAYCELRGYAMLETNPEEVVYSPETHERIMDLMDNIFAKSSELAPDWTNYIHSLIQDITKREKKSGGLRKTKRNKSKHIDNNARTTKRNRA
jgi:hypothetical protein